MSAHPRHTFWDKKHLLQLPETRPYVHLIESLTVLTRDYPPSQAARDSARGLFTGPTSVAYLFLWLSKLYPGPSTSDSSATIRTLSQSSNTLAIDDRSSLDWCRAYLRAARTSHAEQSSRSKAGGIQDEGLAYAIVKAAVATVSDTGEVAKYVDRALRLAEEQLPLASNPYQPPSLDPSVNEWLYGRSGTLYLLRALSHWVPSSRDGVKPLLTAHASHVLSYPQPWTWKSKAYIGAAHGDAGILAQLILSQPSLGPSLEPHVLQLLAEQLPSGNWAPQRRPADQQDTDMGSESKLPARTPRGFERDELVQFCHGAPGVIIALQTLCPHMSQPTQARIRFAVSRARDVVRERGLLTKEPNLCHGISGNALAMGDGDDSEDDDDYVDEGVAGDACGGGSADRIDDRKNGSASTRELMMRLATPRRIAEEVLQRATFTPGSDAYGLSWGEAGRAWTWAVMDGRASGFIGFTDV